MGRPRKLERYVAPDLSGTVERKTSDADPRFNSALARGLAVLRAFTREDRFLTNAELAARTSLPKSTVTRLTYTLAKLGHLAFDERLQQYELAAGVVGLGYAYMARQVVPAVARPFMAALADKVGASVGLGVWEGPSVVYLEAIDGDRRMQLPYRAGVRIPMVGTAMGRACHLSLSARQRQDFAARLDSAGPRSRRAAAREFEESEAFFRTHGYVTRTGGFHPASRAVAVPYVCRETGAVMAFSARVAVGPREPSAARLGQGLQALATAVAEQVASRPRREEPWG